MSALGNKLPPALAWIPWWLSVIMATASYLSLKYLAPHLASAFPALQKLAGFLPQMAPLAAIGFLLLAAVLLYGGDDISPPEEPPEDQDDRESNQNDSGSATH